ncbi:LIM domain kinase 2-like [Panulirus ornatus]|uniref:LIM domain kinase 2-like n=1 Tax=Panulirus ornatus TaxID=150431 RepID=UPI003A86C894
MCSEQILSQADVAHLISEGEVLGEGFYGIAYLVEWKDGDAVLKMNKDTSFEDLHLESYFLKKVDGAGGAPKLLALSHDPQSLLMSFMGHQTLEDLLEASFDFPDSYFGMLALQICERVQELHTLGVVHNDLHLNNILVTDYTSPSPSVSIIDFGKAGYDEAALALLPPEDEFHMIAEDAFAAERKEDVLNLGEICGRIFGVMKADPPESAVTAAKRAFEGDIDDAQELVDVLREAFIHPL